MQTLEGNVTQQQQNGNGDQRQIPTEGGESQHHGAGRRVLG